MTLLAWVASIVTMLRWFVNFYYTMNYDKLYNNWMPNEYAGIAASAAQLILFTIVSLVACNFGNHLGVFRHINCT